MQSMFQGAAAFNQNIGNWDTSKVTNMQSMFYNATNFNQDIKNWNVSTTTTMQSMFEGAAAFNQNIGSWLLNNSVTMIRMFINSGLSEENYSKTLIGWANYVATTGNAKSRTLGATGKTINSTVYSGSPYNTGSDAFLYLITPTDSTGGGWTIIDGSPSPYNSPLILEYTIPTSSTTSDRRISLWIKSLNSPITIDWGDGTSETHSVSGSRNHTYPNVTERTYQVKVTGGLTGFGPYSTSTTQTRLTKCLSFGNLPLVNLSYAFSRSNISEVPEILPSSVTNLYYCFNEATIFNGISVVNWSTSNVTDMQSMFYNATNFNQDIGNWDTSKVTYMYGMFEGAAAFNQNIGSWLLNNSVTMIRMFINSGLSEENYSKTLIGWANYVATTGNAKSRTLGATGRKYNSIVYAGTPYNTGTGARTYLTQSTGSGGAGWSITGDSSV